MQGFNFSSGNSQPAAQSGGFKLGSTTASGTTTASPFSLSTTPLKSSTTPAVASPLTATASTASPFKLGTGLTGLSTASSTFLSTKPGLLGTTAAPAANTTAGTTGALTGAQATGTLANTSTQQTTNSTLTFKILEDYVNKWMNSLDSHEKDFLSQATQLNALDKLMIENGDKIVDLSSEVDRLNCEQDQLEQELNFLYSQQTDLEGSIKKLEDGIEQMPTIPQQHCDTSRIEMYKLLIEVDNQLRSQSGELREVIKRLNSTNVDMNDPIMQINKILNAHMDSLNWIEENTCMIQNQADKLSKNIDERLRETDSSAKFSFLS